MDNIVVLEKPDHLNDCVYLADMREELITQPLAFVSASHEPGNVFEFNHSGDSLFGFLNPGQYLQPRLRHRNNTNIRLNGSERVIGRLNLEIGQSVKKCGFPDVLQTHNSD